MSAMSRKVIPWLPDYDISETGEVRRITPAVTRGPVPYVVSGNIFNGYRRLKLTMPDGKKRVFQVHRLVCEAFNGPPPSASHHAAHWDGDRSNNKASNLRWATALENVGHDRTRHGRQPSGGRNGRARLSEADVLAARSEYDGRFGDISRIARKFNMSWSAMASALKGEHWKCL